MTADPVSASAPDLSPGLVDVVIEDPRWVAPDLDSIAETAATATLRHLGLAPDNFELCVMGCDDARIAALNTEFRDRPTATNVLSWPAEELAADTPGARPDLPFPGAPDDPAELGDIAIAFETCTRESAAANIAISAHITHLIVHGVLHLLGYDHIDDKDADLMQGIETDILATLGVADPYTI